MLCSMCTDVGLAVPEDVAVLGVGNVLGVCECNLPTLSSIDLDAAGVAETAVGMLDTLLQGCSIRQTTVKITPLGVVVRESTDVLAVPDRVVARALRHMWDHLEQNLGVADVAQAVGVSRRMLERQFRCALGRSVNEELRRKRLEQLQVLLRTTDTPIAKLAPLVGFQSVQYLHRAFRKAFRLSPRTYRLQMAQTVPFSDANVS